MNGATPQVGADLEYVFETKVFFRPERCVFGPLPRGGSQGYTPIVPAGPHAWPGRTLIVGAGERRTGPDHSVFTYYAVR